MLVPQVATIGGSSPSALGLVQSGRHSAVAPKIADFNRRLDLIKQSNSARLELLRNSGFDPSVSSPLDVSAASVVNNHQNGIGSAYKSSGSGSPGPGSSGYSHAAAPAQPDYIWADLAKHYRMSASTAYQEALSNTSYQRSVKDMQAAGLNPASIFAAGKANTADGVAYVSGARSGSGRSGYRRSGGRSSSGKLFSQGAYGLISAAAGLAGIALTKRPDGFWIGSQTAKGVMGALNGLFRR